MTMAIRWGCTIVGLLALYLVEVGNTVIYILLYELVDWRFGCPVATVLPFILGS